MSLDMTRKLENRFYSNAVSEYCTALFALCPTGIFLLKGLFHFKADRKLSVYPSIVK